jgi:CRP/FNR family transcriptional regulator, cyclic AMP receptor protein
MNMNGSDPAKGFWGLLTDPEQRVLSDLGVTRHYRPGSPLCLEGDPATHLFVLLVGWVKVLSVTNDGHQRVLALRGHGDIVGEIAGETTGHRTATLQAIGKVEALIIGYDRFSSFMDSHPAAAHAFRREMTKRWRDAAMTIRDLPVTNGAQRLAGLVLELAGRHGNVVAGEIHVEMPLSQEELASLASTSRATVTRALSNWRQRGFIRTGPRHITILDQQGLRQAAGHQNPAHPDR